ncbi:hypothetical protein [Streptomyces sp. NPDC050264]|uniref:hypothetical protein n=1 Tax=Streptomyces sp. NPDC050264 TaxID=3155038 RepID=UPI003413B721
MTSRIRTTGRWCRRAAVAAGTFALTAAAVCATASPASAAGWACDHDGHTVWCASVTGISAGSYLASHNGPSYGSGTTGHRYANGDTMMLACWTTGDGDADGHGDRYWFALDLDSDSGYINDWYVTTGSPSQWKPHVPQCR